MKLRAEAPSKDIFLLLLLVGFFCSYDPSLLPDYITLYLFRQEFTPLTLSAKLANKKMLDHILELKRKVTWVFGDVTCAHYPIADIDTVSVAKLCFMLNAHIISQVL